MKGFVYSEEDKKQKTTLTFNFEGHELEFEKELVETFENTVFDSFERVASVYLSTDFEERTLDEVFARHTEQEIRDVIINAAREEILIARGLV